MNKTRRTLVAYEVDFQYSILLDYENVQKAINNMVEEYSENEFKMGNIDRMLQIKDYEVFQHDKYFINLFHVDSGNFGSHREIHNLDTKERTELTGNDAVITDYFVLLSYDAEFEKSFLIFYRYGSMGCKQSFTEMLVKTMRQNNLEVTVVPCGLTDADKENGGDLKSFTLKKKVLVRSADSIENLNQQSRDCEADVVIKLNMKKSRRDKKLINSNNVLDTISGVLLDVFDDKVDIRSHPIDKIEIDTIKGKQILRVDENGKLIAEYNISENLELDDKGKAKKDSMKKLMLIFLNELLEKETITWN